MLEAFIHNNQYNFIKRQTKKLVSTFNTTKDPEVIAAVKFNAETQILDLFPGLTVEQQDLLKPISKLKSEKEFEEYLSNLQDYLIDFPTVTDTQIKKLFSKTKKLKMPDLSKVNYSFLTYLGWNDIGTGKKLIVYPYQGKMVGIEGRYTQVKKDGVCALCNNIGKIALVTSKIKMKGTDDNYRAVGNYMCFDSEECNKNITDTTYLEGFIKNVLG